MSDTPNIDKAKAAATKLLLLLEEGEAGVQAWHEAVAAQIDTIGTISSFKSAADDGYNILRRHAAAGDFSAGAWCMRYRTLLEKMT